MAPAVTSGMSLTALEGHQNVQSAVQQPFIELTTNVDSVEVEEVVDSVKVEELVAAKVADPVAVKAEGGGYDENRHSNYR